MATSGTTARRIWVGCYTDDMNGSAEGIGLLTVEPDGSLENRGVAVVADSPSFLAKSGEFIYAALEGSTAIAAYRVVDNELHFLGQQDAAGELPCALAVLGDSEALGVACYADGTVDVHPIAPNGTLAKTGQSLRGVGKGTRINQDGPHAHALLQLDSDTVLTTDLGTDDVYVHTLTGDLLSRAGSVRLPAGSGPRDLLPHPSGVVLVLAELSSELFVLVRDGLEFRIAASVGLPGAEEGDHAAALALSGDGRFVYAALRGSDRVSVIEIVPDGTMLRPVGAVASGGGWPRHLVVDGARVRVANQLTSSVVTFVISDDGLPVQESSLPVASPTYLLLD